MSKNINFLLPVDGTPIPLSEVNDYLFNKKIMGEGVAIKPSGDMIYAPIDGEIAVVYESKHAIIIKSFEGLDVLIHVGIDSAKLEGKGFAAYVKVGDKVKAGDKILYFDRNFVEKNVSDVTPIVITNSEVMGNFDINYEARKALDTLMEITIK
jgi:PTS system glucose-specific IIA component